MALRDDVKLVIGLSNVTKYDGDIQNKILACAIDLDEHDINISDLYTDINSAEISDPLLVEAVKLYVRAYFGVDENSEKYRTNYEKLRVWLSMSSKYKKSVVSAVDDEVIA